MRKTTIAPALLVLLSLAFSVLSGCSEKLSKRTDLTADDLFGGGVKSYDAKKYKSAIEYFQTFLERFPTSPLASRAQLMLADARMERNDAPEAEAAFDDFLRLYPSDDNVPYVLFRKGKLMSGEVSDPGRDQTKTREAISTLKVLIAREPAGRYSGDAEALIRDLENRLAEHEVMVTNHYLKRKLFESAEIRAGRALREYPASKAVPGLLSLLGTALEKQGKSSEASEVRKTLQEKFPDFGGRKR